MLWLFRYILGFVQIKIIGDYPEKLLNLAAVNRITLWDLRYSKKGIIGNVGIKGFKKLRTVRNSKMHKIKILRRCGLPFLMEKHKLRIGMFSGFFFYIIIIVVLSNFIWCINIEGDVVVPKADILKICSDLGVKEGTLRRKINKNNYSLEFLNSDDRFAWCAFNVEGCHLNINLTEAKNKNKQDAPSNLKAARGGIIKKIDVISGMVCRNIGDRVCEGDLLVSGIREGIYGTDFLPSAGTVVAETERTFKARGKYNRTVSSPTDKSKNTNVFEFFGIKIPLYIGGVKGDHDTKRSVNQATLFGVDLPIRIIKNENNIIVSNQISITRKMLIDELEKKIKGQIKKENLLSYEPIERTVTETKDGLELVYRYKCNENIAFSEKILINTKIDF